jgi:hypothetical protein
MRAFNFSLIAVLSYIAVVGATLAGNIASAEAINCPNFLAAKYVPYYK